jgi:O-antigen/teichoic acid export membrane protein
LRELKQTLALMAGLSIPLAAIMWLVASFVIPKVFGADFIGAVRSANILLIGGLILGVNYVLSNSLRATGNPGAPAFGEGVGLLVTVLLLPVALPRWGIVGAAWVSVGSYATTAGSLLYFSLRRLFRKSITEDL